MKYEKIFLVIITLCALSFIVVNSYSFFEKSEKDSNLTIFDNENSFKLELADNKNNSNNLTKIKIPQKTIDLGKLKKGDVAEFNFVITNEGEYNLVLSDVEPECNCTIAEWEKSAIKPGDSTTITAIYDTKYPGHFQKLITVEANIPESPFILILRGNVIIDTENERL